MSAKPPPTTPTIARPIRMGSQIRFEKCHDITVGKLVFNAGGQVVSFVRFEVGEGIEVEKVDFVQEVAAQLNG